MKYKCLDCEHCAFDGGSEGYSVLTPSSPMEFSCHKGKWDLQYAAKSTLVEKLNMGESCELFEKED